MKDLTRAWLLKTQGLIEPAEGERLAELAAKVPVDQAIVEIGSHTGLSTCWLAAGSRDGNGAHITAVDPWGNPRPGSKDDPFSLGDGDNVLNRFRNNISGVTQFVENESYWDLVTPLRMASVVAAGSWVKPVGLLFVDAIHTGPAVREDWGVWGRHLGPNAVACFHDFGDSYPGVRMAIAEHIVPSREWSWIEVTDPSLWQGRLA